MASLGSDVPAVRAGWVESPVSFRADGLGVAGTYLHPQAPGKASGKVPAALLIAGSGPTDRNANSRGTTGTDTLAYLARTLADDGVASLRYDKLGSGAVTTAALGQYLAHPERIGVPVFLDQARTGLALLSGERQVDREKMGVVGHSEGGLYALELAARPAAGQPRIDFLGLMEPLAERTLDLLSTQVARLAAGQHAAGTLSTAQQKQATALMAKAVAQLRAHGTVPSNMGYGLKQPARATGPALPTAAGPDRSQSPGGASTGIDTRAGLVQRC